MDQKYFPGVGNYIKSEGLYLSKIHPEEQWANLTNDMRIKLINSLMIIMNNSYQSGGAELKDFSNPFHSSKFKLQIYGRNKTSNNDLVLSQITSDSRKTWFCSKNQKLI